MRSHGELYMGADTRAEGGFDEGRGDGTGNARCEKAELAGELL